MDRNGCPGAESVLIHLERMSQSREEKEGDRIEDENRT